MTQLDLCNMQQKSPPSIQQPWWSTPPSSLPFTLLLKSPHRIPWVPKEFPVKEACENSYNPRYREKLGYNSITIINAPTAKK